MSRSHFFHRVTAMSKIADTIKHELLEMVPPTIYFFVVLHIVALIRVLMIRGEGLPPMSTMSIAIAALVLGKSVLLANALPYINRFPEKPLIWNVCWKSLVYFLVASLIHYLERLYDFWKDAPGFVAANEKLLAAIVWPHIWAVQILIGVLIIVYCVATELARVIGEKELRIMFFGPLPSVPKPT